MARMPWPVTSTVEHGSALQPGASSGCWSRSKTVVRIPRRARAIAVTIPAGPPPTTATDPPTTDPPCAGRCTRPPESSIQASSRVENRLVRTGSDRARAAVISADLLSPQRIWPRSTPNAVTGSTVPVRQHLRRVHHTPGAVPRSTHLGSSSPTVRRLARPQPGRRSRRDPEGPRRLPSAGAGRYLPVPFSDALTDAGRLVPSPAAVRVPLEVTDAVGADRTWMV